MKVHQAVKLHILIDSAMEAKTDLATGRHLSTGEVEYLRKQYLRAQRKLDNHIVTLIQVKK